MAERPRGDPNRALLARMDAQWLKKQKILGLNRISLPDKGVLADAGSGGPDHVLEVLEIPGPQFHPRPKIGPASTNHGPDLAAITGNRCVFVAGNNK